MSVSLDSLHSQSPQSIVSTMYSMVTAMQGEPPATQIVASAALLVLLSAQGGYPYQALMRVADRVLKEQARAEELDENRPLRAFKSYVAGQLS